MKLIRYSQGVFLAMSLAIIPLGCGDDESPKKYDGAAGTGGAGGKRDGSVPGTGGAGGAGGTTAGTGGARDAAISSDAPMFSDARLTDAGGMDVPQSGDAPVVGDAMSDAGDGSAADARPLCGPFANSDAGIPRDAATAVSPNMSFFVTSKTSVTGNLGGLAGADATCRMLAQAAGVPSGQWKAYLSVEHDPPNAPMTGGPVHARDRIGNGPWHNALGQLIANDLAGLHNRKGDASLFVDEMGRMINGQWTLSPTPNEHDILTGSNPDGTLAVGKTCADWTSELGPSDGGLGHIARVGHSDGIGPSCSTATSPTDYTSWNSTHDNAGCNNTAPRGGAGRFYCFLAK